MTDFTALAADAADLVALCLERGKKVATAESCTGGLVAGLITEISGSSAVLERGFVTYSNAAKTELLGVSKAVIATEGAVSEAVVTAMVRGALARAQADIAVAITGIAGPTGGTPEKPVGLVHFAVADRSGRFKHVARIFPDQGRQSIRFASVAQAFQLIREFVAD